MPDVSCLQVRVKPVSEMWCDWQGFFHRGAENKPATCTEAHVQRMLCMFSLSLSLSLSIFWLSRCGQVESKTNRHAAKQSIIPSEMGFAVLARCVQDTLFPTQVLKKKRTESPSSAAKIISASELVVFVPPSTHGWRKLPLCCDRWTCSPGHGHSLWQITCSQLCPAVHTDDPCWDPVLCNPSLIYLASILPPIILLRCMSHNQQSIYCRILALPASSPLLGWPLTRGRDKPRLHDWEWRFSLGGDTVQGRLA